MQVAGELVTGVIGPVGGVLEVQEHGLVVPPGAVSSRTEFSMEVIAGNTIEVELTALDAATGEDVGEAGFNQPVRLSLSYANADVRPRHVDDLVIVRIHPDGRREPLPSVVDRETKEEMVFNARVVFLVDNSGSMKQGRMETTLLELAPRILPNEDELVSESISRAFRRRGIAPIAPTQHPPVTVPEKRKTSASVPSRDSPMAP